MLTPGELGAVVALLEGLAAHHPDDALSAAAVRVAEALHERADWGIDVWPYLISLIDPGPGPGPDPGSALTALTRRQAGESADLVAQDRDRAATDRDDRAAVRAVQALITEWAAEDASSQMLDRLDHAELRDEAAGERAAEQDHDQRTPGERQAQSEQAADRAHNAADRMAMRELLTEAHTARESATAGRHSDLQDRLAARRDREAAESDRRVAQSDRDQSVIDIEELTVRLHRNRQRINQAMRQSERLLRQAERLSTRTQSPDI